MQNLPGPAVPAAHARSESFGSKSKVTVGDTPGQGRSFRSQKNSKVIERLVPRLLSSVTLLRVDPADVLLASLKPIIHVHFWEIYGDNL
jgi:hypothetical protein